MRIRITQSNDELFKFKHGLRKHPLYGVWGTLKKRCYLIHHKDYGDYGGRGITMCMLWMLEFKSFYDWAIENGWHKGLEIDRKNNSGNYEPGNCRFVTRSQNMRNTRRNNVIEYNGQKRCLAEWSEILGMKRYTIFRRIFKYGWSVNDAFEKPVIDKSIEKLPVSEIIEKKKSGLTFHAISKIYKVSPQSIQKILSRY